MHIHTTRNTKFPSADAPTHVPAPAAHERKPTVPRPKIQAPRAQPTGPSRRKHTAAGRYAPRVQPWHRLGRPGHAAAAPTRLRRAWRPKLAHAHGPSPDGEPKPDAQTLSNVEVQTRMVERVITFKHRPKVHAPRVHAGTKRKGFQCLFKPKKGLKATGSPMW